MDANSLKTWTEIISNVASVTAIVAAAWWFFVTTKFKQRIQFDLGCNFISLNANTDTVITELQFIFENKGFIEHRLYNLNVSVHTLESEQELNEKEKTKELYFKKPLLPKVSIVPKELGYYFVRPGARQVITHIIKVPASFSIIRVTASFDYVRGDRYPHTARKVFKVATHQGSSSV